MVFTESDAQNDGLIKREVGSEMAKVARTQNPELFKHFENVCDEVGRAPEDVLGEMAVRALDSDEFADRVLASEVNMNQIKANEIRMEDVKYVKTLSEELGLNQEDDKDDPIDRLIEQRIQSVTQSPLDNFRERQQSDGDVNEDMVSYMESLQGEVERLREKVDDGKTETREDTEDAASVDEDLDSLFGGEDESDVDVQEEETTEEVEVQQEQEEPEVDNDGDNSEEPVGMGDTGEQGEEIPEEDGSDDRPGEADIEEALDGSGVDIDEAWEDTVEEERTKDEEQIDEIFQEEGEGDGVDANIGIPSEDEGDDGFITSEDGEEE